VSQTQTRGLSQTRTEEAAQKSGINCVIHALRFKGNGDEAEDVHIAEQRLRTAMVGRAASLGAANSRPDDTAQDAPRAGRSHGR